MIIWNKIKSKGFPFLDRRCSLIWHNVLPNNTYNALILKFKVSITFLDVNYFIREYYLSKTPSKIQHDHWIRLEVNHLVVQPNQKSNCHYDINRLVYNIPFLCINHILDWLVTVLLWCRNLKPMYYELMSVYFTEVKNCRDKTAILVLDLLPLFSNCRLFGLLIVLVKNDFKNKAQSLTPYRVQAPSCAAKSTMWSPLSYKHIGT